MKLVPLTNGGETLVDDDDYERVMMLRWGKRLSRAGYWYARSTTVPRWELSRYITGATKGYDVDHRDHNTLNNQRSNIRVTTRTQNQQNRIKARVDSLTKVRGVTLDRSRNGKQYLAYANLGGKRYYFGLHVTLVAANIAAIQGRAKLMTHAEGR